MFLRGGRSLERAGGGVAAEACTEIAAIHYYMSGRVFKQPTQQSSELTQKQRDEIATFGRVSTRHEDDYSNAQGFLVENWRIEDESAQGLRLVRGKAEAGKRHTHGQLLGVRPGEKGRFMLGQVRWLMQAANGDLHAGVRLLPGLPSPIAARGTGLNVQTQEYVPAIALSAVAALNAPPSLVIPPGWYKPKRVLEIHTGSAAKVRLTDVVERGSDFERVLYEKAE